MNATTSMTAIIDGFFQWGYYLVLMLTVPLMIYKFVIKPFQK